MAELKMLIRKRGGHKRSITMARTHYETIYQRTELEETDLIELTRRIDYLEELFTEFRETQSQIETICEEEDLADHYDSRDQFENGYFTLTSKIKALIEKHNRDSFNDLVRVQTAGSVVESVTDNKEVIALQLPKMQLPRFSGQYDTWVEFKDIFISLIHSNSKLTDVQKLHYLKSSLSGQAAQKIQSLKMTEVNFKVAWELLCERYDNKRLLVNNHINGLLNLPLVKFESSLELRKLLDEFSTHILALEALGQNVHDWNTILVSIITQKLDHVTKREWETTTNSEEFPTLNDIKTFLKKKCEVLEKLETANKRGHNLHNRSVKPREPISNSLITRNETIKCNYCGSDHLIYNCNKFLALDGSMRNKEVRDRRLCINCLKKTHFSASCKSSNCKKCNKKHHTLLHDIENKQLGRNDHLRNDNSNSSLSSVSDTVTMTNSNVNMTEQVLLSTALVYVTDNTDTFQYCRALLDSGSQSSFITTEMCDKLGLQKTEIDLSVLGINKASFRIKYKVQINLQSRHTSYNTNITCFVIDKITGDIPSKGNYPIPQFTIPRRIKLADINFNKPGKVDMLLGSNIFWDLLCPEKLKLRKDQPFFQKTLLGWIVTGPFIHKESLINQVSCNFITNKDVQTQLQTFWELEECENIDNRHNLGENDLEKHFVDTTKRNTEGRFIVSVPFREPRQNLGNSLNIALKRFYNLERKLNQNPDLKEKYIKFMTEYRELGHMAKISNYHVNLDKSYYIPHHGVSKENSLTTKLRVVFNASCKTTNNVSFNDIQLVGPTIQDELFNILLRFRIHKFVLSADVEKMYRQVLINPDDRNYQRILWRENPNDKLEHYTLNTVTYGTASAPYLAVRALHQTAHDLHDKYPNAAQVILRDFYVDDLLTGTNSISEAIQLHKEVTCILNSGCFHLRQWTSNNMEILKQISSHVPKADDVLYFFDRDVKKTLGLIWLPFTDTLKFDVSSFDHTQSKLTKRIVLSTISKLFDPLGLVGPCIITAKLILQELWSYKLEWDDNIPDSLQNKWLTFQNNLLTFARDSNSTLRSLYKLYFN